MRDLQAGEADQAGHANALEFLSGGGEMGARMRAHDWGATPLGPPQNWPQSLKTAVRIMLLSRQPIWIGWGDELIYFYNDSYKSIIGGKHPRALGRPTTEVWQEIWEDIGPLLATAMGGDEGTYVEEQLLIMERNGYPEETYYTFSYTPIPNDDGNPGGIICANTDDTQRVIGERQLALLRELATASSDARSWREACERSAAALSANTHDLPFALIYMAEPDGRSVTLAASSGIDGEHSAFPGSVTLDGSSAWPFAEVLSEQQSRLITDLAERAGAELPSGAWRQLPDKAAMIPILPAGETGRAGVLLVGLSPFRLFDDSYQGFLELVAGQIAGVIGNAQAYEEERRRAEALAEIDRAKTAFFSNVSHEFRTPLTLMLGPLEESLAEADRLIPQERERVQVVHRNGMRLLKLVNSLLDFSRIEAGRAVASFEQTDLCALTADLVSNFRSATEKAGIELVIECETLAEPVYVDRDMWEKIVLNLLSNAFKFTFEGKIAVELKAKGDAVELIVRDTGTGIPAHELPRLFERFHRIEGARGRSFEGSGIGLALVQELVKLHSGTIRVESEEGSGSAFIVSIPLGARHLPQDHVRRERTAASTAVQAEAFVDEALRWLPEADGSGAMHMPMFGHETPVAASGERRYVLLADDNADMRDYVRRLLGPGHEVETVADGEAALEAVRRRRPDLLLTDIMMPGLDGFSLIHAIRDDPEMADLPIVVLSARAGEEARVEGLDAGADDYLAKPFSARELIARVDTALAMARVRREMDDALREEAIFLETLNRIGSTIAAELDLDRTVQVVTDAARELTGAAFGAFFYNVADEQGESYMLYTISGVPREAFARFPMPRNTAIFGPTFRGEGVVRSDDITKDPRYGRSAPHHGMPEGHLPVRSYLAAPVASRSGEILGGLFFGHPEPGIFTERAERILVGIAAQAAIAIDNARLYQAAQAEIAERKRTEAALRESEERLSSLNETLEASVAERTAERDRVWRFSSELMAVAGVDGYLKSINSAWTRLLGYDEATLLSRPFAELIHPDDLEEAAKVIADLGRGRDLVRYDDRLRRADGTYCWIAWTATAGGDHFYAVGRDITAEKEAAEALQQAEAQLRQAQKMEAVGKLTGGVAHDFNNLLQVIGGNLQLLSKDLAGHPKAEQRLQNALAGVSRGSKLASQLLAFGRRQALAPKVVNLGRFIRGIDDMLHRALGDGIEIETLVSDGLWNTLVDPSQVENALLNLAINARDAMEGHGKLTIEAGNAELDEAYAARHPDVAPGEYVMLTVTDTGAGMSPQVLEHAFEPFFTTKPEGQGTGLGLSMVWGLVKQSDGHIKIDTEAGKGTTISIYLPRSGEAEDVATEAEEGPVTGGTETVLVVEDDEDVRNTVVEMLSDFGYRVLEAKDAESALAIIEGGTSVDLLFTDVVMPGSLRSPELARRARERLPDLAVLFTSGYADDAIVHRGRLDEGVELLGKPYTREALARKIRHVLGSQPRVAGGASPAASHEPEPTVAAPPEQPQQGLRILVVEDEFLILLSTTDMLEAMGHTVLEAGNVAKALTVLGEQKVDLLLADLGLPDGSGADLAVEAKRRQPDLPVVFASGANSLPEVEGGELIAGAVLLSKPYDEKSLLAAIEAARK